MESKKKMRRGKYVKGHTVDKPTINIEVLPDTKDYKTQEYDLEAEKKIITVPVVEKEASSKEEEVKEAMQNAIEKINRELLSKACQAKVQQEEKILTTLTAPAPSFWKRFKNIFV